MSVLFSPVLVLCMDTQRKGCHIGFTNGGDGRTHGVETMTNASIKTDCPKCSGTGHIRAFSHIKGGSCFSCDGRGYHVISIKAAAARKRRAERSQREQANQEAQHRAQKENRLAKVPAIISDSRLGPEVVATLRSYLDSGSCSNYACDIVGILDEWDRDPSWIRDRPWIVRNLSR